MSTEPSSKTPLSYRQAGVDIDAGNALVERIKPAVARTRRAEVLGGLGGFGALFRVPIERYREPVLVSGTDGVGTKLKLAQQLNRHDGIGIDLVAMCVNDVLVQGAEPLYFLDYFACGKLDVDVAARVVEGIAAGCEDAGCALVGGETAEMPDMYPAGEYDLAGFCVGIVERSRIIDGSAIRAGHRLLGLASSGPHSNGYSLIRRILARCPDPAAVQLADGQPLLDALLAPTRIYVRTMLDLLAELPVDGMAHITGGGLVENIVRVLPQGLGILLQRDSWPMPAVFDWMAQTGAVEAHEMARTFNLGIGFVLVVEAAQAEPVMAFLRARGEQVWDVGQVVSADHDDARFAWG